MEVKRASLKTGERLLVPMERIEFFRINKQCAGNYRAIIWEKLRGQE
jgi:hypothetical protein